MDNFKRKIEYLKIQNQILAIDNRHEGKILTKEEYLNHPATKLERLLAIMKAEDEFKL